MTSPNGIVEAAIIFNLVIIYFSYVEKDWRFSKHNVTNKNI